MIRRALMGICTIIILALCYFAVTIPAALLNCAIFGGKP